MKKDIKQDLAGLINRVQEQIAVIDKKIDTLISKSSPKPVEVKSFQRPFQQPGQVSGQGVRRQDNGFRERVLYKAICADCKKGCEVPFKPSGERPVYCKECFSRRKAGGPFKERFDSRPKATALAPAAHMNKPEAVQKKPAVKKKPASRKKKK